MLDTLQPKGIVQYEHVRGDLILRRGIVHNDVTIIAKTFALDRYFGTNSDANSTWFIGLVDSIAFTGFNPTDTLSSHAGWQEFTNYLTGTQVTNPLGGGFVAARAAWGKASSASGQQLTNALPGARFPILGSATVQGIFLAENGAKGDSVGLLWSTALFDTPLVCGLGEEIRVVFTIQL